MMFIYFIDLCFSGGLIIARCQEPFRFAWGSLFALGCGFQKANSGK